MAARASASGLGRPRASRRAPPGWPARPPPRPSPAGRDRPVRPERPPGQDRVLPADALAQPPRHEPVGQQRGGEPRRVPPPAGLGGGEAVLERGAEVGVLGPELAQPGGLVVGQQVAQEAPRHPQVPPRVPPPSVRLLVGRREPLRPVLAHRADQPVPAAARGGRRGSARRTTDLSTRPASTSPTWSAGTSGQAATSRAAARSNDPAKTESRCPDRPLGLRAQLVGPVDRGPQRLVPRHRAAPRARQHRERGVKAIGQLGQRQRPHPDGGELDRRAACRRAAGRS